MEFVVESLGHTMLFATTVSGEPHISRDFISAFTDGVSGAKAALAAHLPHAYHAQDYAHIKVCVTSKWSSARLLGIAGHASAC